MVSLSFLVENDIYEMLSDKGSMSRKCYYEGLESSVKVEKSGEVLLVLILTCVVI